MTPLARRVNAAAFRRPCTPDMLYRLATFSRKPLSLCAFINSNPTPAASSRRSTRPRRRSAPRDGCRSNVSRWPCSSAIAASSPATWLARAATRCCARSPNEGIDAIVLEVGDSVHGAVESRDEAKACAALFRKHADKIAGVVVTLPNFGDERGDRRDAASRRPERAGACPRDRRRPGEDGHRQPARRVLRQDVRLQRSHAVRHSVLADVAAHAAPGVGQLPRGSPPVRRDLPRGARSADGAHRRDRRSARGVQDGALQREDSRGDGHRRRADRSVRDPRPRRIAWRTTMPTFVHKLGEMQRVRPDRRHSRAPR